MPQPMPMRRHVQGPVSSGEAYPADSSVIPPHLRPQKPMTRMLCLHYFSNMLGFNFADHQDREVYPMETIKEWTDLDYTWVDVIKEKLLDSLTEGSSFSPKFMSHALLAVPELVLKLSRMCFSTQHVSLRFG